MSAPLLLPAGAQGFVYALSGGGARGVFQADLTALIALTAVAGFGLVPGRRGALALGGAVLASVLVHFVVRGGTDGALSHALLGVAVGVTAAGIAGVGRAVGAPRIASGAIACGVLWLAMTGLFWADRVSAALPEASRRAFRQAVLDADPATASAYDAADFDRMHDADVYARVPLASTLIGRPSAAHTAGAWLVVGCVFWGLACLGAAKRRTNAAHEDNNDVDA